MHSLLINYSNIFLFAIKKDHKSYNNFFFLNISAIIIETIIQKPIIIKKPYFKSEIIPRWTFMPRKDATIVGTEKIIVILVNIFIAWFRLLDIIVAYASDTLLNISLYIFH